MNRIYFFGLIFMITSSVLCGFVAFFHMMHYGGFVWIAALIGSLSCFVGGWLEISFILER